MFSDSLWQFVSQQAPLSLVGVASARSSILDFLGVGAGSAPPSIIGSTTLFGQPDAFGVGGKRMELAIATGTSAFVGAGVSLNVQLQVAADAGTPTYQPSTWTTLTESGAIPVASLTASILIWRNPFIPPQSLVNRPRFVSLNFVVTGGLFTTGQIAYALPELGRDDLTQRFAARNYNI